MGIHDTHSGAQPDRYHQMPTVSEQVRHERKAHDALSVTPRSFDGQISLGLLHATLALLEEQKRANRLTIAANTPSHAGREDIQVIIREMDHNDEALRNP